MEYKTKTGTADYKHITPLFSALDLSYEERSRVNSSCERPCVCFCVCKKSSMDFSKKKDLEKEIEELFEKALVA